MVVIVVVASAIGGMLYYLKNAPLNSTHSTSHVNAVTLSTVSVSSFQITNASLTSGGDLSISIKNTGNTNLIGAEFSFNPSNGMSGYAGGWNPNPGEVPIYPGETVEGGWILFLTNQYKPGLQVTVSVVGWFYNGLEYTVTYVVTVS